MTRSTCGKMIISQLQYLHAKKGAKGLHLSLSCCSIVASCCLFIVLMETSESIARMLSGLDPSDLMGGDQEALTEFITNYFDQEEAPEGKLPLRDFM